MYVRTSMKSPCTMHVSPCCSVYSRWTHYSCSAAMWHVPLSFGSSGEPCLWPSSPPLCTSTGPSQWHGHPEQMGRGVLQWNKHTRTHTYTHTHTHTHTPPNRADFFPSCPDTTLHVHLCARTCVRTSHDRRLKGHISHITSPSQIISHIHH